MDRHIQERHRHRFEFNSEYRDKFEAAGMMCVGENPESNLVEVVEIPALKWFVGFGSIRNITVRSLI